MSPARFVFSTRRHVFFASGDTTTDPPEAEPAHEDSQTEKYRHLIPLECPIAAGGLVHQDFPELADAGSCAPALEASALTEEVPANCVTRLVDDPIGEDPGAGLAACQSEGSALRLALFHARGQMER